jgi:hypothetical protein
MIDGINLYWYVHNNPTRFRDPLGLFPFCQILLDWVWPKEDPNRETPWRDQIENALDTIEALITETIFYRTPGLPPGVTELAGAGEAAPGIAGIAVNRIPFNDSVTSDPSDPNYMPIPPCAGGGRR